MAEPAREGGAAWWQDPMPLAVTALGISQIIGWGTTLYSLGVLARPIAESSGWGLGLVFAGYTVGVLASGLVSTPIGHATDRWGGRLVMSIGSVLAALGLVLLSLVRNEWEYLLAWAALGPAMRMTLYDAAFASLVEVVPSRGRRAISYLTLFGGFASTVFWPIGHALAGAIGWRHTCLVFAALNLLVCLPLHWWGLARREAAPAAADAPSTAPSAAPAAVLEGRHRTIAIVLFALATSASSFIIGSLAVHLPALLEASGLTAAVAVALASVKGVAQVAGRVGEIAWGSRLHALDVGRLSIGLMPFSFVVLMAAGATFTGALVFTILFGIANGLVTIVRGAVPLALFGREGYGALLGLLATPYLILNAIAPAVIGWLAEAAGYAAVQMLMLACGLLAAVAIEVLAAWYRRLPRG